MGCGTLYNTLYSVMLEYSIDTGKTWHAVVDECAPPNFVCNGYHLSSQYVSEQHINWTRITVYLPPAAMQVSFYLLITKFSLLLLKSVSYQSSKCNSFEITHNVLTSLVQKLCTATNE